VTLKAGLAVTGTWQNTDCGGATAPVKGTMANGIVTNWLRYQHADVSGRSGLDVQVQPRRAAVSTCSATSTVPGGSPPFLNLNDARFALTTTDTGKLPVCLWQRWSADLGQLAKT
jgi:hypothetical protein